MLKKILMSTLASSILLLSGCGGDDEGESRLETQQMLDEGDFVSVIEKLEPVASSDADYINLGSAYMGKAGLTITDIISAIADGADDENSSDGFSSFVTGISKNSSSSALLDLDKSVNYFKKVVGDACGEDTNKSSATENVCLYVGLASTGSAAVTIDLIAGDIESFSDDNTTDEKLTASTCAMKYAFDKTVTDCSVTEQPSVYFVDLNTTYIPLLVTVNSDTDVPKSEYHYLMTDANRTVLTNGYCTSTDFTTRTEEYNATATPPYYACPINETPETTELTTAGILVDVLNDGMDSIVNSAGEDIQADIDEFKCDVLNGTFDGTNCYVNGTDASDVLITEQDIIDYLNSQN